MRKSIGCDGTKECCLLLLGGGLPISELHPRAQSIGLVGTAEVLYEGEAKLPSGTGTASGKDVAIDGDLGGGVVGALHGVFEAGVAGGLLALEKAETAKHEGSCTDGRDDDIGLRCLGGEQLAQACVGLQIGSTGQSAGQEEQCRIGIVALGEQGVGHHGDAVSACHGEAIGY